MTEMSVNKDLYNVDIMTFVNVVVTYNYINVVNTVYALNSVYKVLNAVGSKHLVNAFLVI